MYSHLTSTLKPNVIVLLGDIFSDGFQASADQWKDYLMVWKVYAHQVSVIWIPLGRFHSLPKCYYYTEAVIDNEDPVDMNSEPTEHTASGTDIGPIGP